jgi:dolichol-phosphate mannosyltransferase
MRRCKSADASLLSIVVPVHNEARCLRELYRRLCELPLELELIFVDDGSSDESATLLRELGDADGRVHVLGLSENHGSQHALLCGMQLARGDVICTMDADLQHPPELIPRMFDAWRSGYDVVEMVRRPTDAPRTMRDRLTEIFYRVFNQLSPVAVAPDSTDFRLLDRRAAASLRGHTGELLRAMVGRLDASRTQLAFDVAPRFSGRSRYGLVKLLRTGWLALAASTKARFVAPEAVAAYAPDWVHEAPPPPLRARADARSSEGS